MDNREEVRQFLQSRRAKVPPEQAGLAANGARRVAGLRRSEVAALAGISLEYYAKLERGALAGASAGVLESLARALQLDEAERAHLFDLAQAAGGTSALSRPRRRSTKSWTVRPSLQWVLDAVTAGPAFVRNGRLDLLTANRLGRIFYDEVYANPQGPPNLARYAFLDSASRRFYPDWEQIADITVAMLRTVAGRDPTTRSSTSWSGNCRPAVTSSAPAGPLTTSAITAVVPRTTTTTSLATSLSPTKAWRWRPRRA